MSYTKLTNLFLWEISTYPRIWGYSIKNFPGYFTKNDGVECKYNLKQQIKRDKIKENIIKKHELKLLRIPYHMESNIENLINEVIF